MVHAFLEAPPVAGIRNTTVRRHALDSASGNQPVVRGRLRGTGGRAAARDGRHRPRRIRLRVGAIGCGKSTFLSILALLDTPTTGRYWLSGRPVDRLSPGERARARNVDIGLIFQSFNLIGDLTVYENVEYPLTIRGASAEERHARVTAALERVGIAARAKQRPASLSGGHQQLVAIARAIAGRPPIVLADEPTGNLDSASGEAVMQMLDELHQSGSTVCIATHDPRHIARARRQIYLFDGRVVDRPEA